MVSAYLRGLPSGTNRESQMAQKRSTTLEAMRALLIRAGELSADIHAGLNEAAGAAEETGNENGVVGCLIGFEKDLEALVEIVHAVKTLQRCGR